MVDVTNLVYLSEQQLAQQFKVRVHTRTKWRLALYDNKPNPVIEHLSTQQKGQSKVWSRLGGSWKIGRNHSALQLCIRSTSSNVERVLSLRCFMTNDDSDHDTLNRVEEFLVFLLKKLLRLHKDHHLSETKKINAIIGVALEQHKQVLAKWADTADFLNKMVVHSKRILTCLWPRESFDHVVPPPASSPAPQVMDDSMDDDQAQDMVSHKDHQRQQSDQSFDDDEPATDDDFTLANSYSERSHVSHGSRSQHQAPNPNSNYRPQHPQPHSQPQPSRSKRPSNSNVRRPTKRSRTSGQMQLTSSDGQMQLAVDQTATLVMGSRLTKLSSDQSADTKRAHRAMLEREHTYPRNLRPSVAKMFQPPKCIRVRSRSIMQVDEIFNRICREPAALKNTLLLLPFRGPPQKDDDVFNFDALVERNDFDVDNPEINYYVIGGNNFLGAVERIKVERPAIYKMSNSILFPSSTVVFLRDVADIRLLGQEHNDAAAMAMKFNQEQEFLLLREVYEGMGLDPIDPVSDQIGLQILTMAGLNKGASDKQTVKSNRYKLTVIKSDNDTWELVRRVLAMARVADERKSMASKRALNDKIDVLQMEIDGLPDEAQLTDIMKSDKKKKLKAIVRIKRTLTNLKVGATKPKPIKTDFFKELFNVLDAETRTNLLRGVLGLDRDRYPNGLSIEDAIKIAKSAKLLIRAQYTFCTEVGCADWKEACRLYPKRTQPGSMNAQAESFKHCKKGAVPAGFSNYCRQAKIERLAKQKRELAKKAHEQAVEEAKAKLAEQKKNDVPEAQWVQIPGEFKSGSNLDWLTFDVPDKEPVDYQIVQGNVFQLATDLKQEKIPIRNVFCSPPHGVTSNQWDSKRWTKSDFVTLMETVIEASSCSRITFVFHVGVAQFGDQLMDTIGSVCNAGVEFVVWNKGHTAPQRNTFPQVNTDADLLVIGHWSQHSNVRDATCYKFGPAGEGRQCVINCNIATQLFKRPNQKQAVNNTQLPLALIDHFLEYILIDGLVLDACSGSGSCLIACLLKGVKCLSIELDKDQVQGIHDRVAWLYTKITTDPNYEFYNN